MLPELLSVRGLMKRKFPNQKSGTPNQEKEWNAVVLDVHTVKLTCSLYICVGVCVCVGGAYHCPTTTALYIFSQQIYLLNFFDMLHNLHISFLHKTPCISYRYLFCFIKYSHFRQRVC
jgi:hypothetical protein